MSEYRVALYAVSVVAQRSFWRRDHWQQETRPRHEHVKQFIEACYPGYVAMRLRLASTMEWGRVYRESAPLLVLARREVSCDIVLTWNKPVEKGTLPPPDLTCEVEMLFDGLLKVVREEKKWR